MYVLCDFFTDTCTLCVCVCEIHFKLTFLILLFNRLDFTICFAAQYFYEPSFISTKTLFGCSKTSTVIMSISCE